MTRCSGISVAFLLCLLIHSLSLADEGVPPGSCVLELTLPSDAKLTVDGRDYGAKRRLTFNSLQPGKILPTTIRVRFADQSVQERLVYIEAGRLIRLAIPRPSARRPELALQSGHSRTVSSAAFSHDGHFVVTGSDDSTAILWEVATGLRLRTYAGHTDKICGVAFTQDNTQIITGSNDGTVIIWDRDTGRRVKVIPVRTCVACDWLPGSDGMIGVGS